MGAKSEVLGLIPVCELGSPSIVSVHVALGIAFGSAWQVWLAICGVTGSLVCALYVLVSQVLEWPRINLRQHLWALVKEATSNAIDLCV